MRGRGRSRALVFQSTHSVPEFTRLMLDRRYGYDGDRIANAVEKLVSASWIRVEDPNAVQARRR